MYDLSPTWKIPAAFHRLMELVTNIIIILHFCFFHHLGRGTKPTVQGEGLWEGHIPVTLLICSSSSSCISFKITEYIHELGARIGAQPGWLFEAPLLQSVDPDPPPTAAPPRATRSTLNVKFQRWPPGGPPGATPPTPRSR